MNTPSASEMSHQALHRILNDYESYDFDALVACIRHLSAGITAQFFPLNSGWNLYRGVIHTDKPSHVDRLGRIKDPNRVRSSGRCHIPGQSVFYGSLSARATFDEIGAKSGDLVYISRWKVTNSIDLPMIGKFQSPSHWARDFQFNSLRHLLHHWMTLPMIGDDPRYKVSAAIARAFGFGAKGTGGSDGVAYSSVALAKALGDDFAVRVNLAIAADTADQYLKLEHVAELKMCTLENGKRGFDCTDYASSFDGGAIRWAGTDAIGDLHWLRYPDPPLDGVIVGEGTWSHPESDTRHLDPAQGKT